MQTVNTSRHRIIAHSVHQLSKAKSNNDQVCLTGSRALRQCNLLCASASEGESNSSCNADHLLSDC